VSATASGYRPLARAPARRLPAQVWVLIAANAVIALGYGFVSPVLPQYARDFGVSISAATFVITAFALIRLCFAPVSGLLVQRMGERRVYVGGILIVALSTGMCAFAHSYWQLLLFRSLGGIGSTMFFVSSLGLMIRVSPEDCRGRVAGMFSTAFLVGSVGGPVLGSLSAGLGLSVPFVMYGVALLVAAGVVFVRLRHSTLAAPEEQADQPVTLRIALRQRAYRAALLSNFATGWAVFGLRMALVPLFVTEALGRGAGMAGVALATFAAGNVSAVIPSGYLSDRIGRRTLLIVGLSVSGLATAVVGAASSLPLFLAGAFVAGAAAGMFSSPQQAAVADIVGSQARAGTALAAFQMMADFGSIVGSFAVGEIAQRVSFGWAFVLSGVVLLAAALAWVSAPETRGRPPTEPTPARPMAGSEVCLTCDFERWMPVV
jgi:ACDE family multidrug resistance protein